MAGVPTLSNFDCEGDITSVGARWQSWKRALHIYLEAVGIEEPHKRKATLLHYGGLSLQEIFYNLPDADAKESDNEGNDIYTIAIKKLDEYFAPKQSKIYERHIFRLMKQVEGEKFEKFLLRLRYQGKKCGFKDFDEQLIDQITEKCSSTDLRKRILTIGDGITLDAIVSEANSLETIERQLSDFNEHKPTDSAINSMSEQQDKRVRKTICSRCGFKVDYKTHQCPAKDATCRKCQFKGHFARCCKSKSRFLPSKSHKTNFAIKKTFRPKEKVDCVSETEEAEYVFHIDNDEIITCKVGGINIKMLIDSGSKSNIISRKTWEFLKTSGIRVANQTKQPNKILFAYGAKQPLCILGSFVTDIKIGHKEENATFYVVQGGKRDLMGKNTAIALGVLKIGIGINSVHSETFPKLKNVTVHIPIDRSVKPICQPYRRIPIPLESKVNKKLEELAALDIIEEVNEPSGWVSPIVPVLKENGDVRICIDMRRANTAIMRENHPLPTMDTLLPKFRKARVFSKLDIKNAFHQIEISPESRYITTFISSRGLFRYKRLLFGINAAPEIFQKIMEKLLLPCEGTVNFIDDILIYGANDEQHDQRVKFTLDRLRENNILLNKEKCIFKVRQVRFLGHILSAAGIRPLEEYMNVIKTFRAPITINEVHSFLGLVNFIGKWIPNLATLTEPLRELLRLKLGKSARIKSYWKKDQEQAFEKIKRVLQSINTLGYYDPKDKTQVIADASPVGLGAVLIQYNNEVPRIIAFGNKSLTDVEKRYCQTEKEALALVWAVEHFKIYLFGKEEFELITDHKPLEVIFGPRSRPCARIERWVLRLQAFNYKIKYHPGKNNIADSLSRLCRISSSEPFETHDQVNQIIDYSRPIAVSLKEIQEYSEGDEEINKIKEGIEKNVWSEPIRYCQAFRQEFCTSGAILLRGSRIVMPKVLRQRVMEAAHEGHPGIVAMKGRLRTKVWWPKMDEHAEKFVKACKGCTLVSCPSAPHPMKRRQMPNGPWIDVAVDFMGPLPNGNYIFVIVDYYSRYREIKAMKSITAKHTVNIMKEICSRLGFPASITADNGRQFVSEEMKTFCTENGIKIFYTIPYWPQMNGEVERQNRDILKRLKISQALKTNWENDLLDFQIMYNVTPHSSTGKSPGELFFNRQFRDKLPSAMNIEHAPLDTDFTDKDKVQKEKGKQYGDRKRKAVENGIRLAEGEKVYVKNLTKPNKITPDYGPNPHTVVNTKGGDTIVKDDITGNTMRRNVVHLKRIEGEWSIANDEKDEATNPEIV